MDSADMDFILPFRWSVTARPAAEERAWLRQCVCHARLDRHPGEEASASGRLANALDSAAAGMTVGPARMKAMVITVRRH
jgi:hypothetical protein